MLLFPTRVVEEVLICRCYGDFCASAKQNYISNEILLVACDLFSKVVSAAAAVAVGEAVKLNLFFILKINQMPYFVKQGGLHHFCMSANKTCYLLA